MRVEAPYFKRCLCCLPLRYGLLVTGYLKLFIGVLTLISWIAELASPEVPIYWPVWLIVMKCFEILLVLGDIAMAVVFLIGGHKKDSKLLKIYYYYSIGFCVLNSLLWFGFLLLIFVHVARFVGLSSAIHALRFVIIMGVFSTVFQVYLIFLTRSEILKLENNTQFSFSNNANEAQCAMVDETGNYVNYFENVDIVVTQPTLVNDENETKDSEPLDNDDEEKIQNRLFNKLNGNYAKLN